MPSPDEHPIWTLAKEALKIQGGTIHQLAKVLHIPPLETSDLLLTPGELCFVKGQDGFWWGAKFISYDVWHNKPEPWVSCTVTVASHGLAVDGVRVGANMRASVREDQRGDL